MKRISLDLRSGGLKVVDWAVAVDTARSPEPGAEMVTAGVHAIGVLDSMIERGEVAIERYRARLDTTKAETFSAKRLRATIQVMRIRLEALRLSRSRQQSAIERATPLIGLSGSVVDSANGRLPAVVN